jgi:hypothetical protein
MKTPGSTYGGIIWPVKRRRGRYMDPAGGGRPVTLRPLLCASSSGTHSKDSFEKRSGSDHRYTS